MNRELIQRLDRFPKTAGGKPQLFPAIRKEAEEGGCGVVGFCCSEPVPGRHIYEPSRQMHNRGNGKGGGIAAVGLRPGTARRQPRGARQPLPAARGVP